MIVRSHHFKRIYLFLEVKREELDKAIALLKEESSSKEIAQKLEDDKEGKLRGKDIVPQLIKIVKSNEENSNIVSGSLLAIRWLKDDQGKKVNKSQT